MAKLLAYKIHLASGDDRDSDLEALLPDPKVMRSMSKATEYLARAALPLSPQIQKFIEEDPFSVGLYFASDKGPLDYRTIDAARKAMPEDYAVTFSATWPPKQYLKHLANIGPAQIGILLGAMGPTFAYTDSEYACWHAIRQAEIHLESGLVRAALVGVASSHEDPLIAERIRHATMPGRANREVGAALLFVRDTNKIDWQAEFELPRSNIFYGAADPLVHFLMRQGAQL